MRERVLVIIPAYNESGSIVAAVENVVSTGYDYVVVNDGSTDSTLLKCREHGFNVLDLPVNLGIGGAVQAGHLYALAHGYDYDVQFDGDGQHESSYIPMILQPLIERKADLVVGSRFISGDGFQSTFVRRIGIKWLAALIKLVSKKGVLDCTSGFRACNRRAIELFAKDYSIDFPEPESLVTAARNDLTIAEVPVVMHERRSGKSSIGGFASVYYMIKVSLAIVIAGLRRRRLL